MKALAVGATGTKAGLVVPELVKRGVEVRALVRAEGKADVVRQRGATEIAIGDLDDPGSLRAAVEGIEGVFHINPGFAPDEAGMGVSMVKAAAAGGVSKFVFSSIYHPSLSLTNHAGKRPVEEALYDSGMDFTVLQPAMFMQNLGDSWPSVLEQGQIAMPYATLAKVCYVDYRDVAEVAAAAMTGTDLSYGTFELCAPGVVTRVDIAQMMSEVAGRRIEAAQVDFDQWAAAAKIPDGPIRDGFKRMYADYDQHGFAGGNALILHSILGRQPRAAARVHRGTGQPLKYSAPAAARGALGLDAASRTPPRPDLTDGDGSDCPPTTTERGTMTRPQSGDPMSDSRASAARQVSVLDAGQPSGEALDRPRPARREDAMNTFRAATLIAATLTMGLTAGVFSLYAHTIMPGLGRTDDRTFVDAFQSIDKAIINPWFMLGGFVGALVFTALAAGLHLGQNWRSVLPWIAAALVLYLVAVVITVGIHVPLNDGIKAAGNPDRIADLAAVRDQFHEGKWATWNAVRAVTSVAAVGCLSWALVLFGRATP